MLCITMGFLLTAGLLSAHATLSLILECFPRPSTSTHTLGDDNKRPYQDCTDSGSCRRRRKTPRWSAASQDDRHTCSTARGSVLAETVTDPRSATRSRKSRPLLSARYYDVTTQGQVFQSRKQCCGIGGWFLPVFQWEQPSQPRRAK